MGLVACLLVLHLAAPAFTHSGRGTEGGVTASATATVTATIRASDAEPVTVSDAEPVTVWGAEAEAAGEPCPCEEEPSARQPVARTPRTTAGAAGANSVTAGAGSVTAGAPAVDRGGTDLRAAGAARRPGVTGAARNAVELQTFRC
ncbi:hypothetical protein ACFY78_10115 [Streptomyces olindensis]|uniref:hypothetical protein n=1 Tax=Streptomyces olindensis TaxID=358823 RepID=UPI0036A53B1F